MGGVDKGTLQYMQFIYKTRELHFTPRLSRWGSEAASCKRDYIPTEVTQRKFTVPHLIFQHLLKLKAGQRGEMSVRSVTAAAAGGPIHSANMKTDKDAQARSDNSAR